MTIYCLGFLFLPNPDDPALPLVALILKQRGPPDVVGRYNGHGGKVNEGERPIAGMIRETTEELGVETDEDTWTAFGVMRGDTWRCHLFVGWMPEGQEAKQMGDEAVAVFVAAECAGDRFVSNIPALLTLAEHALDEPAFGDSSIYIDLRYLDDLALAGAVAIDEVLSGRRPMDASATSHFAAPFGDEFMCRGDASQPFAFLRDGVKRPIFPNTETRWIHDPPTDSDKPRHPRPYTHVALLPEGTQPNPDCVIATDLSWPSTPMQGHIPVAAIVGAEGGYAHLSTGPTMQEILADDLHEPFISEPDFMVDEVPHATRLMDATAILAMPKPLHLELQNFLITTMQGAGVDEAGNPMAIATSEVDWSALANTFKAALWPDELVDTLHTLALDAATKKVEAATAALEELRNSAAFVGIYGGPGEVPPVDVGIGGEGAHVGSSSIVTTAKILDTIRTAQAVAAAAALDPLNEGQDKGKSDAQLRAEILDLLDQLEDKDDMIEIGFGERDLRPWQIREAIEDQRPAMLRLLDSLRDLCPKGDDAEAKD
jgi:ADP-ribose pyrophosphatase YjhB (NUDIX family)